MLSQWLTAFTKYGQCKVFFVDTPKAFSLFRQGWQGHISLVSIQLPLTTIARTYPYAFKLLPMLLTWWKPLSCWDGHEGTKSHPQTKNGCMRRGDADRRQGGVPAADACWESDECHVTAIAFPSSLLCWSSTLPLGCCFWKPEVC